MKKRLSSLWKYVAAGWISLASQGWYDRVKSKAAAEEMKNRVNDIHSEIINLHGQIDKCVDPVLKSNLIEHQKDLEESLRNIDKIHSGYLEKAKDAGDNGNGEKLFNEYNEQFTKAFKKAEEIADKIDKSLNISSNDNKFIDMNFIWEKITEYKDFLSTLSFTELCLLMNILMSIFIFTCLVSIIFAVYGNFLIDKLSLEQKYPKLSSLIRIRVNLQHYYIMINTLFIVLGLIFIVYINVMTFIHG